MLRGAWLRNGLLAVALVTFGLWKMAGTAVAQEAVPEAANVAAAAEPAAAGGSEADIKLPDLRLAKFVIAGHESAA